MNYPITPASAPPQTISGEPRRLAAVPGSALVALPGQPLCRYYTGAALDDLHGDYACCCDAGVPYERWTPDMERWPCRRRHILGVEQHGCTWSDYRSEITKDVDAQLTEMTLRAIGAPQNDQAERLPAKKL